MPKPKRSRPQPRPQPKKIRSRRVARRPRMPRMGLSMPGECFLKCAFAAPDFANENFVGIPDTFGGKVLVKRTAYENSIAFAAGRDTYIIIPPIVGYQYFHTQSPIGIPLPQGVEFTGSVASDYNTIFSSGDFGVNYTSYRYISQSAEIIPLMNDMTWSGSITCFKIPVTLADKITGAGANFQPTVEGLEAVNSSTVNRYTGPFRDGVYSVATTRQPDFKFKTWLENILEIPATLDTNDYGRLISGDWIPGIGDLDTIVIKVSVPTGAANQSAVMRVWNCIEFQPNAASQLNTYAKLSPDHDPSALAAYRYIAGQLPPAVAYYENANFWEFVKKILGGAAMAGGALSVLPGPYGAIAGSLGGLAGGLARL